MGGCSSKPRTAECNEGHPASLHLLLHTSDSSPPQGSQHTLKSLFIQHGRDGDDLLGNAQTLHELLLHTVDSKELPDFENQSTEENLQISSPCKQKSPVSVLSNAVQSNAAQCTKMEGSLPNLAESNEETRVKLESFVSNRVQEAEEKCSKAESLMPNSAEANQEKGAANLEGFLSGLEEEKCCKFEVILPALPENAEVCINTESFMSNVAEENQQNAGKSVGLVPNFAEVKLEEECSKLGGLLSNFAEENASKLESESSPRSLNLEPKSDLLKIPESNSSECETRGLHLGPKSDVSRTSETTLLESPTTDVFQKNKASDADESKEVQGLNGIAMKGEIKREVQEEIAMEAEKIDERAMKCEKNVKALQCEETKEQIRTVEGAETEKAMATKEQIRIVEGEETEKAKEGKKTGMQCEKALEIEKGKISQQGEKAEVQNEKAMEGEFLNVQFESGGISRMQGKKAMEDALLEKTKKAMECEEVDMQCEKVSEGRKTGVQDENSLGKDERTGVPNERVFYDEVEKFQGDVEDENAVCMEKPASALDAEKKESQDENKTGVQDEKTSVQRKKAGKQNEETGVQNEETGVHHEGRAEDEKAIANVTTLHVQTGDEEAMADVTSSHGNQSFAFALEHAHTKHTIGDSCFEPLTAVSEQSIVATACGPILELASSENTIEAAELGLIEKLNESDQKMLACICKDNTEDVVDNFGLTEKVEVDLKKLASDGSTIIEAVGLEDVEKPEFEKMKARNIQHSEKIKSLESSIEAVTAVAGGGGSGRDAELCNASDNEQSRSTDSEQTIHIERHGKLEHDTLCAAQRCEADELDDMKNAKAPILEESLIEAAIGNSESINQVIGEKKDDKSSSELCANSEKKAPEALVEQSLHEGSSTIEFPLKLVVEKDTSDVKAKMEVSCEEVGFVLKDHGAEKLQGGYIQMPTNELAVITSKDVELHAQVHDKPVLCSIPESGVHENLPCPTVVQIDVEKHVADINSSSISAAEKSFIESVENKPRQKTSAEAIDDAYGNAHVETSKQCEEK